MQKLKGFISKAKDKDFCQTSNPLLERSQGDVPVGSRGYCQFLSVAEQREGRQVTKCTNLDRFNSHLHLLTPGQSLCEVDVFQNVTKIADPLL